MSRNLLRALGVGCCIVILATQSGGLLGGVLFPWHPLLMSAGFLGFMTEGISTALAFRHLEGGPRVRAIQRHGWVQVASTVCIALGFLVIYTNKVNGRW